MLYEVITNIPILFQDLKIDNRLIRPAKGECIDKHLSYKPNIQLKHYQNSFSISFARITSYNVCYTKLLRTIDVREIIIITYSQMPGSTN